MNKKITVSIAAIALLAGCGVRGRPEAPLEPAELGRGKPSFTRSNSELALPNVPSPQASPTPPPDGEGY